MKYTIESVIAFQINAEEMVAKEKQDLEYEDLTYSEVKLTEENIKKYEEDLKPVPLENVSISTITLVRPKPSIGQTRIASMGFRPNETLFALGEVAQMPGHVLILSKYGALGIHHTNDFELIPVHEA